MKIAMIGHKDFPSRSGGVEVVVYELATRMQALGHDITVYNRGRMKGKNCRIIGGVRTIGTFTFRNPSLNAMVASFTATVRALFGSYDCIHYHALGPSVMVLLAKLFGKRTVVTVHGLDYQRAKWNRFACFYLKLGEKIAAKYADEVIVLSENVQQHFQNTYHRRTVLIQNAVVPVNDMPPREIKMKLGIEKNSYILYLARIVPEKGLHYLIDAYKSCNTDKKLVIAGELPDTDYGKKIKEMARECPQIVFAGFVTGQMMEELYANCALYVLPSEIEGLALTLLEAMSVGANCLVSDILENTAVGGAYAQYFRSGDTSSLKQALQACTENAQHLFSVSGQKEYIYRQFGYERVVADTLNVYRSVIKQKGK